jgi:hypothetical protein
MGCVVSPKIKYTNKLFDRWSILHFLAAFFLTTVIGPLNTIILLIIWEIVESYGQSRGWRLFMPTWDAERFKNRWIGDIISDALGIAAALLFMGEIGLGVGLGGIPGISP